MSLAHRPALPPAGAGASDLEALGEAGAARARRTGQPVMVSLTQPAGQADPIELFALARAAAADAFFWAVPDEGVAFVGAGAARLLTASGPGRFGRLAGDWRRLASGALVSRPPEAAAAPGAGGPVLLGGFAFDPQRVTTDAWAGYPDGLLLLPQVLFVFAAGRSWLTTSAVVEPDGDPAAVGAALAAMDAARRWVAASDPAPARPGSAGPAAAAGVAVADLADGKAWRAEVAAAAAAVRRGDLEKVVLARAVRLVAAAPFDPARALSRLRDHYPGCALFALSRGTRCFLGATPEWLVRLHRGRVRADCLAGSTARGRTPAEDRRLGEALLASAKDRSEHAVVLRALTQGLAEAGVRVDVPEAPALLKVRNVQHLHTPLAGLVRNGVSLLELAGRLHPTPAVGGHPREAALAWIRQREGLDRGWYAGPVGWVDRRGEGELAVAIRSALVDGAEARLFAGCGIMADSDPDTEYAEADLKLRPMLQALAGDA